MSGPTYVPAIDLAGYELWVDAHGRAHSLAAETFATNGIPDGWRRLYVREEPTAVDADGLLDEADTLIADQDARVDELVALLNAEVADDLHDCHPPVNLAHWDREASFAIARPAVTR